MRFSLLLLFMAGFITFNSANAQETAPGDACTAGETNIIREAAGPETSGVYRLMRCDGTVWQKYGQISDSVTSFTAGVESTRSTPGSVIFSNDHVGFSNLIDGYTGNPASDAAALALRPDVGDNALDGNPLLLLHHDGALQTYFEGGSDKAWLGITWDITDPRSASGDMSLLLRYDEIGFYDGSTNIFRYDQDTSSMEFSRPIKFSPAAILTPSQLTSNQNNYNPANFQFAGILRLSSNASRDITGLNALWSTAGRILVVDNVGNNPIILRNQSASSTAQNRFSFSGDITLAANSSMVLTYDNTLLRWRAASVPSSSDNLGNHIAAQNIQVGSFWLSGDGGSEGIRVDASGNIGINKAVPLAALDVVGDINYTGVLVDVSDARMKKDIEQLSRSLERLRHLRGVSFVMKNDDSAKRELGLIAQDVHAVYPDLVHVATDGTMTLNYIGLFGPVIESIKELDAQVAALKSENAELTLIAQSLSRRIDAIESNLSMPVSGLND